MGNKYFPREYKEFEKRRGGRDKTVGHITHLGLNTASKGKVKEIRMSEELQRALIATDEKLRATYESAGEITRIVTASARREVAHDILSAVRKLVKKIDVAGFDELKAVDKARVIKGYIETLNILASNFKDSHEKTMGEMSDEDLERIASSKNDQKPN